MKTPILLWVAAALLGMAGCGFFGGASSNSEKTSLVDTGGSKAGPGPEASTPDPAPPEPTPPVEEPKPEPPKEEPKVADVPKAEPAVEPPKPEPTPVAPPDIKPKIDPTPPPEKEPKEPKRPVEKPPLKKATLVLVYNAEEKGKPGRFVGAFEKAEKKENGVVFEVTKKTGESVKGTGMKAGPKGLTLQSVEDKEVVIEEKDLAKIQATVTGGVVREGPNGVLLDLGESNQMFPGAFISTIQYDGEAPKPFGDGKGKKDPKAKPKKDPPKKKEGGAKDRPLKGKKDAGAEPKPEPSAPPEG